MTHAATRWIMVAHDGGSVASACLRRAAALVRRGNSPFTGLLVAVAGIDADGDEEIVRQVQRIVGPDLRLEIYLLHPGDPTAAFGELAASHPDAYLATPLPPDGRAAWYRAACRDDGDHGRVMFRLTDQELATQERSATQRSPRRVRQMFAAARRAARRLVRSRERHAPHHFDAEADPSPPPTARSRHHDRRAAPAPRPHHQDARR